MNCIYKVTYFLIESTCGITEGNAQKAFLTKIRKVGINIFVSILLIFLRIIRAKC